MSFLKLEGFKLRSYSFKEFNDSEPTYVLPVYSFTCACQKKVILKEYFFSEDVFKIFRPKYYHQFVLLNEQKTTYSTILDKIPSLEIKTNERCPIHPVLKKDDSFEPGRLINSRARSNDTDLMELYNSFNEAENLKIGPWLEHFAVYYWVKAQYAWFTNNPFHKTKEEKEKLLAISFETKLLDLIKPDIKNFSDTIHANLTNIIPPLINLICDYSESPLHTLARIIQQLKHDIIKYF